MILMKGTKVHIRKKSLKLSASFLFTLNGTSVHYEIDIFLKKKTTKQHNLLFWLKKTTILHSLSIVDYFN